MLFVGNLPWILDSWGLEKLFEPFGKVVSAKISFDHRTDRSRGYGFVVFEKWTSAKEALARMKQKEVGGRRIDVQPAGSAPRVTGRGDIDEQAMRINPANENARYGQAPTSNERQMFENTVAAMDLDFLDKFSDPYYNVSAEDWAPCVIEEEDDELAWGDYKVTYDYYDPIDKALKRGAELEPLREDGPGGPRINWDEDFCADPVQVLSDGREYLLNDPDRPVPENFDQIFIDNDERRTRELMEWDGESDIGDIEDLRVATRGDSDKRQRRPGDMNNKLNIVDPFGKRTVRRGLREKASAQMGSIDRMKEMENVLKRAGTKLPQGGRDHDGLTEDERRRMERYEADVDARTEATARGGAPASRWTVVKKDAPPPPPEADGGEAGGGGGGYVPPKDGYMLVPPGGGEAPAAPVEGGGGSMPGGAGEEGGAEAPPKPKAAAKKAATAKKAAAKKSAAPAAGDGEGDKPAAKSRGRPRKDGTPAQPRKASAAPKAAAAPEGGSADAPKKRGGARKKVKGEESADADDE